MALLDVHDPPGAPGLDQQIGLAAEERGDLQDVRRFGRRLGLRGFVNIGEHGKPAPPQPARMRSPSSQARAAIRRQRWCGWLYRTKL